MILVIAEQRDGALNQASLETVAAAQQMSDLVQGPVKVVLAGGSVSGLSGVLAAADIAEVLTVESEALATYTVDGFVDALAQVIAAEGPDLVLFPHTYQTRDYAPKLATRLKEYL